MQLNHLAEEVKATIFMEGLRTPVVRTEVIGLHPSTFEEAVDVALNAEVNFKADRYGTQYQNAITAESMDLSYAEDEAELHAAEQQRNIRRCYMCGSTKHLRPSCPLRKQRQPRSNQVPAPGRKSGAAGGNVNSQ